MEDIKNSNIAESEPAIEVVFDCLVEDEVNRVKYLCSKYEWYRENGYKPTYPKSISEKFEKGEKITEEDIEEAVSDEFDSETITKKIVMAQEEWDKIKERFFESLKTLGLPLQEKYYVSITEYGTGGSYGVPDNIQLNFNQTRSLSFVIAHEIVHLTIEHLIREYKIDHWTKERLVDLIMNKFFPENPKLQRNPPNAEQISEIFEREFPNIEKVILEVSKLKNENNS
jgi:uncharacterized protein YjaZ